MKILTILLTSLFLSTSLYAKPLNLKDKKGREITVTVTAYDAKIVTFLKGTKEYTVPWETFDQDSIELIKNTRLPDADNKRMERKQDLENQEGKKQTITIPAGKFLTKDGKLDLYVGDIVHLEFQLIDGKFTSPDVVAEITKPQQTATFELINEGGMTTLKRSSKIQKTVAVNCSTQNHGAAAYEKALDIYPISKAGSDEFAWPGNVWHVQLSKIEVSEKTADEVFAERAQ